jgi:hypothetical protein
MIRHPTLLVLALAVFAGLLGAQSGPPDGVPDLSGTWTGKLKIRAWDQSPSDDDTSKGNVPVRIDISQNAADITFRIYVEGDEGTREFVLAGQIGQGNAWAVLEGPDPIMMLSAHLKKNKLKGTLLVYEDFTVAESTFTVTPDTFSPVMPVPGAPSGSQDGLPGISGPWTGKHKWTGYAMYDPGKGEKSKEKGKNAIDIDVGQTGSTISLLYTVRTDEGDEILNLTGAHGNGHFYALGLHPKGGPVFLVGHVKKNKLTGRAITTFDSAVLEAKFTVKRPK